VCSKGCLWWWLAPKRRRCAACSVFALPSSAPNTHLLSHDVDAWIAGQFLVQCRVEGIANRHLCTKEEGHLVRSQQHVCGFLARLPSPSAPDPPPWYKNAHTYLCSCCIAPRAGSTHLLQQGSTPCVSLLKGVQGGFEHSLSLPGAVQSGLPCPQTLTRRPGKALPAIAGSILFRAACCLADAWWLCFSLQTETARCYANTVTVCKTNKRREQMDESSDHVQC